MNPLSDSFRSSELLPEEISRIIFELAAEAGDGPSCALVSKKVQLWVEPIIYRSIILSNPISTRLLCRTIWADPKSNKSAEFLALHVKAVVVDFVDGTGETTLAILKACRNLETLGIWSSFFFFHLKNRATQFFAIPLPTLRRLSLTDMIPKQQHFSHRLFSDITHLDITHDQGAQWVVWRWDALSTLKHLTHMSVDVRSRASPQPVELVRTVISYCPPSLLFFIIWPHYELDFEEIVESEDIRAICEGEVDIRAVVASLTPLKEVPGRRKYPVIVRSGAELMRDLVGRSVGDDSWTQAERIVEERRRRLESGATVVH